MSSRIFYRFIFIGSLAIALLVTMGKHAWNMRQQYKGVCLETGQVMSDEERLHLIALDVYNQKDIIVKNTVVEGGNVKDVSYTSYKQIPYDSPEEFFQKNPNCCRLKRVDYKDGYPDGRSMFLSKALGVYAAEAEVHYIAKYYDENHDIKQAVINTYRRISNCGYTDVD